jgi:hypothetical protein
VVQVVAAVAGDARGEQRREASLLQLSTTPYDCAHIYLVAFAGQFLPRPRRAGLRRYLAGRSRTRRSGRPS